VVRIEAARVTRTALVIGGTGPSGPEIVATLLAADFEVCVLHRGAHEPDGVRVLHEVEHIHADPHFLDRLRDGLGRRTFDVVVATYGRMTVNVEALSGRCERFVGVGGNPVHPGVLDSASAWPSGMRVLADEGGPIVAADATTSRARFAAKVVAAERSVMAAHARGAFAGTYLRYPTVYGPRAFLRAERAVLARLHAGRRRLLLPEGGLAITSRLADRNAAHAVRCVLEDPGAASGEIFQCADDVQYSMRQWLELVSAAVGQHPQLVSVPTALAGPVGDLLPTGLSGSPHVLVSTTKIKQRLGYADVVRPAEYIHDVVREIADNPGGLDGVTWDPAAEDALLGALDALAAHTGVTGDAIESERAATYAHSYDHPAQPAS
jgi:nucleoside-diphosphate-sugar epimerase